MSSVESSEILESTVTKQVAVLSPALAIMVADPSLIALTTPLLTVATEASELVQVTVWSVASSGLTVAVRVTVSPAFNDALVLSSEILVTGVGTTMIEQVAVFSPALAVIVAVPTLIAVTIPLLTLAMLASEVLQITVLSVTSSGLTVAVRVAVSPTFNDALVLSRVILVTGVGTTVIEQVALLSPALAVIVAEPNLIAVTTPSLTVATEESEESQVIVLSVASSGLTVAVRVRVSPTFRDVLVLLRVTLVTGVGTTVTEQVAVLSPAFAVIVADPNLIAVTTPSLTVTTLASEVLQFTVLSVAFEGLTLAVRVSVSPTFRDVLVLLRVTLVTGVAITVIEHVALWSPALAVMMAVPTLMAVTTPLFTVTTDASEVVQVTVLSVASSGLTVAVRVTVSPAWREALVLSRVTLVTGVATTVTAQVALLSPALAVMVAEPTFLAVTTPLLTVAAEASEVVQVTVLSVASSGLTVAVRVTVSPAFREALVLSSVILVTGVATTVIAQVAVLFPALAVMVAVPTLIAVTTPLSIVATEASEVLQVTVLSVVSSGLTVAVRVTVSPALSCARVLSSSIELTSMTFLLTVMVQVLDCPPAEAVMIDVPSAMAVTKPVVDMVATDCFDDAQVTVLSDASLGSTVALN